MVLKIYTKYLSNGVRCNSMEDISSLKSDSQKPAIRVSEETKERIAKFGYAGESLETALVRALVVAERHREEVE